MGSTMNEDQWMIVVGDCPFGDDGMVGLASLDREVILMCDVCNSCWLSLDEFRQGEEGMSLILKRRVELLLANRTDQRPAINFLEPRQVEHLSWTKEFNYRCVRGATLPSPGYRSDSQ